VNDLSNNDESVQGLNIAVSTGLQLLSRYRLQSRFTENYGMGRLPNNALTVAASATKVTGPQIASSIPALQPACLILVSDGECLHHFQQQHQHQPLQIEPGKNQLLREFYKEPFRWDQRVFCLNVGGGGGGRRKTTLHHQLHSLCEVTGGSYWNISNASGLPTNEIIKLLRPPIPRELPITPDPLFVRMSNTANITAAVNGHRTVSMPSGLSFVNAGPVCCIQAYEMDEGRSSPHRRRAMLLYTGSPATNIGVSNSLDSSVVVNQPLWCVPESYFPSKKLDTLPPRLAQPVLYVSKYPANLLSKSFEPMQVIKMLQRLDQLLLSNRRLLPGQQQSNRSLLHRDTYVCEWLLPEGDNSGSKNRPPTFSSRLEYFPVFCLGAGRPSLSDDSESLLNIGILHVPLSASLASSSSGCGIAGNDPSMLSTLTFLPPEPHILLPLLIRIAEAEHRVLKKYAPMPESDKVPPMPNKIVVPIDEHWRSEFQGTSPISRLKLTLNDACSSYSGRLLYSVHIPTTPILSTCTETMSSPCTSHQCASAATFR